MLLMSDLRWAGKMMKIDWHWWLWLTCSSYQLQIHCFWLKDTTFSSKSVQLIIQGLSCPSCVLYVYIGIKNVSTESLLHSMTQLAWQRAVDILPYLERWIPPCTKINSWRHFYGSFSHLRFSLFSSGSENLLNYLMKFIWSKILVKTHKMLTNHLESKLSQCEFRWHGSITNGINWW